MKILYCSSEAVPFASTGGLAEVAGSLPKALKNNKVTCRVVMPLYSSIPKELQANLKFVTSISVPVAWRRQYCGVFEAQVDNITYYLIDNQYYFKRDGEIYGHFDDAERFSFFSRAILEMLPFVDYKPDIIQSNDWQTALVPMYYRFYYSNNQWFSGIKTIFTIHNIEYQGKYNLEILEDVFGIPKISGQILEYDKNVNLMKGAIECANWVTTVSPTYAKEITDPWYSCGLDSILRQRSWKLTGILNGIDTVSYNPATDGDLYANYDIDYKKGKAENKKQLQERLKLEISPDAPLIGMVTRLVEHKGLDFIESCIDNVMQHSNAQMVILGSGDGKYANYFKWIQGKYPGKFNFSQGYVPELSRKIYAASDLFLMPSKNEPCGLSQMIALRYGSVPVVRETGGLKDTITDCGDGKGNGFTFQSYNSGDMLQSLNRAIEMYNSDKEEWEKLVIRAMKCDFSWDKPAQEYVKLYKSLLSV